MEHPHRRRCKSIEAFVHESVSSPVNIVYNICSPKVVEKHRVRSRTKVNGNLGEPGHPTTGPDCGAFAYGESTASFIASGPMTIAFAPPDGHRVPRIDV